MFRNITANGWKETSTPFLTVTMAYGSGGREPPAAPSPPLFRNISFFDVTVDNTSQVAVFQGLPTSELDGVHVRGLVARDYDKGIVCANAHGVVIEDAAGIDVTNCSARVD